MFKNPVVKNILSAIAVAVFGFILLNLAFLQDFFFQSLIDWFIKLFTQVDLMRNFSWLPPLMHGLFVIVIGIISLFVFRSKLKTLLKSIYMTVPLAVVFVSLGMFFYRWPIIAYLLGGLTTFGLLYYFYHTKKPWLYYYTLILVSLTLSIFSLMGGEIQPMKENGGLMGWIVENATEIKAIGGSAIVILTAAYLYIAGLIKEKQRKNQELSKTPDILKVSKAKK